MFIFKEYAIHSLSTGARRNVSSQDLLIVCLRFSMERCGPGVAISFVLESN